MSDYTAEQRERLGRAAHAACPQHAPWEALYPATREAFERQGVAVALVAREIDASASSHPRRAPIQREHCWAPVGRCKAHAEDARCHQAGTVAWDEHAKAWEDYAKKYGRDQSAERLADRGGFSYFEITIHLGHEPTTWEPR